MKTKSTLFSIMFFVCTNLSVTTYAQAVNVQDSLALVALYHSTDGGGWKYDTYWLYGPVSSWYGITVTNSRVTAINLPSNRLDGSIPVELGNLVNLTTLDLSSVGYPFNYLTGSIPAELGNLVNLTSLNLYSNKLAGNIPAELGNLVNLTSLNLYSNKLAGSIPAELGNLVNLTSLNLFVNQLTGGIPVELGNLVDLTSLDLGANQLTGGIPVELGNLVNLTTLSLGGNQLSSIPPELGNLVNLTTLYLGPNQLSSIPPELGNLVNLTTLSLGGNQLSSVPTEIGNLANLTFLELGYNKLSSLPQEIGKLVNLTDLILWNNQLTNLPSKIGNLVNLTRFELSGNRLTFNGLEFIIKKIPYVTYYGQANIPLHQNSNSLFVSAGGTLSNNTYNWYKVEDGSNTTIVGDSVFHPSTSGKYYAAVTNSICTQLTLKTDTIDYDITLPVTLINLKAEQQGSIIKVDWSSLTEINMERYEVQRSANANAFSTIGSVTAKANGTAQQNYSFNDLQPLNGNNYYRLKAIDKDGSITCSKIVLVNISGSETFTIVYPVPAKDILHIQTNGSATFSLVNQAGKILLTTNINGNGSMNVGGFAAGLYYLKNNNTGSVQKVVITK